VKQLLLLAASLTLAACQPQVPPAPRNLVVICLDTVRYDSFLERDLADQLTPWLDRAQWYANTTSPAPWTLPSVVSLFTGLYPVEHGSGRFSGETANLDEEIPSALDESAVTLAEQLNTAHFRTGAFVSHPFFRAKLGLRQGFQVVHNRRGWFRDLDRMWQWADRIKPPDRFFGYLHFMEAHHRHTGSDKELRDFLEPVDAATLDRIRGLWPDNCADPDARRCLQTLVYETAVMELRIAVAQVLQDLEERGLLDQTLVLVYSDHGEEFWDHEAIQRQQDRDPRKHIGLGHGQSMYQELLHVPLLAWHPGLGGQVHQQPVSLIDVLPSVLRWLEIETEGPAVSGQLLPPLYRDWFGRSKDRVMHASGIAYGPPQVATRQGDLKAIVSLTDDGFEVYDLRTDPGERHPLHDDGLLLEFQTLAGDYLERPAVFASARGELGEGQLEDLKAIGYLQGVENEAGEEARAPEGGDEQP